VRREITLNQNGGKETHLLNALLQFECVTRGDLDKQHLTPDDGYHIVRPAVGRSLAQRFPAA